MTAILIVLAIFTALFVLVPLLERSKVRMSNESVAKFSRWILPLALILAITQLIRYMW